MAFKGLSSSNVHFFFFFYFINYALFPCSTEKVLVTVISCNNSYNVIQYNVYKNFTFHTFGAPTDTGVIQFKHVV